MLQDLRFALRTLRKSPGFTLTAVLTLALGIGADTGIYTVVDGVLLHPVSFADADRLVHIYQKSNHEDKTSVSYPNLLDWQQHAQSFESLGAYRGGGFTMTGRGDPEQVMGSMITQNFLSVLRVQPVLGRNFTPEEDQRTGRHVLMLGEGFWKRRFASDPHVLGQVLTLDGRDHEVIGVVSSAIRLDRVGDKSTNDVFLPIAQYNTDLFYDRGVGDNTTAIGRLKPGVTLAQAQAEMTAIAANLASEYPNANAGVGANVVSLVRDAGGAVETLLLALTAAVAFVMFIACANVANLALNRSMARSQEFSIRLALGAGRRRLMRQLLTESMVLAIVAGVVGVMIAVWHTNAAITILPSAMPALSRVEINYRVLLFTFVVSVTTGVLFGLAPAIRAGGVDLQSGLKHGGRSITARRPLAQNALMVGQVALTLVLLVGAGLMIRTPHNLWNVSPGFKAEGAVFFYTGLSANNASTPQNIRASFRELNNRFNALPGIESASLQVGGLPLMGNTTAGFQAADEPQPTRAHETRIAHLYAVTPNHFRAMGIPLLRGRSFTAQDTEKSPLVTVIDEEFARTVFPGQDPIGKRIRVEFFDGGSAEIIGVAGRVKHSGIDSDATDKNRSEFYFPIVQLPDEILSLAAHAFAVIVRSNTEPEPLMRAIRKELAAFDNGAAVQNPQPLADLISASLVQRKFSLIVLSVFAAMALVLSMVGVYGVISYSVTQRTREIGIRMALGAAPRDIFLRIIREGAFVAALGIAAGAAAAAALMQLMKNLLFGVSSSDPATFLSAVAVLFLVTLMACYLPARRAVRVDAKTVLPAE